MSKKYIYYFSEGNDAFGGDKTTMKNILGGKGSGLAEMTAAGMPVPQGFTITTEACTQYYTDGRQLNDALVADIFEHVKGLEEITGKKFGDNSNPLLVSVRSGARQSMPGMMDTILNLGLNDEAVEGLAKKTGNPRFAYDCYRRFVQMFADVVMMVPKSLFEVEIDKMKEAKGYTSDADLTADDLKELVAVFKKIYEDNEGRPFPQDPKEQLVEAVKAVFRSWDNPRANVYRKMNERDPATGREIFLDCNPRMGRNSYYNVAGGVNPMEVLVRDAIDGADDDVRIAGAPALYTLVPLSLLRRYVRDEELLAEVNDLILRKRVFDPQRYAADRGLRRMIDVELTEKNQIRKFARYYPEATDTSF